MMLMTGIGPTYAVLQLPGRRLGPVLRPNRPW